MLKKISESTSVIAECLAVNDDVKCNCIFPHNVVFSAYQMSDIVVKAAHFVNPLVFALEYHQRGSRVFFACSYDHFAHYLFEARRRKPQCLTWHEILTNLTPIRLYFDLEYYKYHNPNVNGDLMITKFKDLVSSYLDHSKNVQFTELDATTEDKFSRHIIINDEFASLSTVFDLVCTLEKHPVVSKELMIFDKAGKALVPIFDCAVYHNGQNFRMLMSPKFGKNNTLTFLERDNVLHAFQFHTGCQTCESRFNDSLVTLRNGNDTHLLSLGNLSPKLVPLDLGQNFLDLFDDSTLKHMKCYFRLRIFTFVLGQLFFERIFAIELDVALGPSMDKLVQVFYSGAYVSYFYNPDVDCGPVLLKFENIFQLLNEITSINSQLLRFRVMELFEFVAKLLADNDCKTPKAEPEHSVPNNNIQFSSEKPIFVLKKCRKNLSNLRRFFDEIDFKSTNDYLPSDLERLNATYKRMLSDAPSVLKNQFPSEICNPEEINQICNKLSKIEVDVRNARASKTVEEKCRLEQQRQQRMDQEEDFRSKLLCFLNENKIKLSEQVITILEQMLNDKRHINFCAE